MLIARNIYSSRNAKLIEAKNWDAFIVKIYQNRIDALNKEIAADNGPNIDFLLYLISTLNKPELVHGLPLIHLASKLSDADTKIMLEANLPFNENQLK